MTATLYDLRHFQSGREQVQKLGLGQNAYRAVVQRIASEQREGKTGAHVAGELAALRHRLNTPTDPTPPEAA